MVGFNVNQRNQCATKLMPAKSSLKEEAHPFKFLLDPKFVMIKVMVVTALLHLKLARRASTATQLRQRIDATTVRLEKKAHKERRNVKNGMYIFYKSELYFFFLFSLFSFLVHDSPSFSSSSSSPLFSLSRSPFQ